MSDKQQRDQPSRGSVSQSFEFKRPYLPVRALPRRTRTSFSEQQRTPTPSDDDITSPSSKRRTTQDSQIIVVDDTDNDNEFFDHLKTTAETAASLTLQTNVDENVWPPLTWKNCEQVIDAARGREPNSCRSQLAGTSSARTLWPTFDSASTQTPKPTFCDAASQCEPATRVTLKLDRTDLKYVVSQAYSAARRRLRGFPSFVPLPPHDASEAQDKRIFRIPLTGSHDLFYRRTPAEILFKIDQLRHDEIVKVQAAVAAFFRKQPDDVKTRSFDQGFDATLPHSQQVGILTCVVLVHVNWGHWAGHPKFKTCDSQDDFFALLAAIEEMEKSYQTMRALGIATHQPCVRLCYKDFRHPDEDKLWLNYPQIDLLPNTGREVSFEGGKIIFPR